MKELVTILVRGLVLVAFTDTQFEEKNQKAQQRCPGNGFVDIVVTILGSESSFDAANPTITTAKTIPGLIYTFCEATSIDAMSGKTPVTCLGDGYLWTPTVTVKGGNAAFYSIGVTK